MLQNGALLTDKTGVVICGAASFLDEAAGVYALVLEAAGAIAFRARHGAFIDAFGAREVAFGVALGADVKALIIGLRTRFDCSRALSEHGA